jgi:response regulator RpfG family c-di-GMP phosphodiesterase
MKVRGRGPGPSGPVGADAEACTLERGWIDMHDLHPMLDRSELFANLEAASVERIGGCLQPVTFEPGRVICREGEAGDCMYIIVDGRVSVSSEMGWGQRELEQKVPYAVFGEMALMSDEVRSATVTALERTECLQLDRGNFSALLDTDPALARHVAKVMTKRLSALVHRTSTELLGAYRALMFAIAGLTESRDPETGAHLERTRNFCVLLAEKLSRHAGYRDRITHPFIDGIYQVSPLHDVGKVAVPDAILLKPARLTSEEFEVMKTHTTAGASAFEKVLKQSDVEVFRMARRICLHHHERWDGAGYPARLAGEAIPLESRIMALADVYDALRSKRVYKPAMSLEATREEIRKGSGTQFDPAIADTMVESIQEFDAIHAKYQDG